MSKKLLMASSLAAALVAVATSSPASAAAPPWCSGLAANDTPTQGDTDTALTSRDPRDALYALVGEACHPDGRQAARAGDFAASRERWSKELGMSPADWADVVDWAKQENSTRGTTELHAKRDAAWSKLGPVEQYAAISFAFFNHEDGAYMADALGGRLTEAGRLAYLTGCMRDTRPAAWAMCAGDIAAFDVGKMSAELRADAAAPGWQRMTVRLIAFDLRGDLAKHAADVKEAIASDLAYGKMFELAAQARTAWDARATQDASLRELAAEMDDARVTTSRHALEGCGGKTDAAWRAAVGAIPATKFGALRPVELKGDADAITAEVQSPAEDRALAVVASDPAGYLASLAVQLCGERALPGGSVLARWPGMRGPRSSALSAILGAGLELDHGNQHLEYPASLRDFLTGKDARGGRGSGRGVVLSIKASGEQASVEFVHKPYTYNQCVESHETNKIVQILPDGTLVRESVCTKQETKHADARDGAQTVSAADSALIKPGTFAVIEGGHLMFAWAKSDAALPSVVLGVAVR